MSEFYLTMAKHHYPDYLLGNLNIPCKLTLGQAPSKKDKSKRIFARIKSIRIINGLDSDLKIDKPIYDIELKLIGVNRGKN